MVYRSNRLGVTRQVPVDELMKKLSLCKQNIVERRKNDLEAAIHRKVNQVNNGFLRRHGLRNLIDYNRAHAMMKKPKMSQFGTEERWILESYEPEERALNDLQTLCTAFTEHDMVSLDTDTALILNTWTTI